MSEYSSDEDLAWGKKNIKTTPTKQPTKQPPKPAPRSAANKPAQARPGQTRPATNGTHHTNGAARQSADVGDYLGMDDYMKHMDKELATTNVGKSFIREERKVITKATSQYLSRYVIYFYMKQETFYCFPLHLVLLLFVFICQDIKFVS